MATLGFGLHDCIRPCLRRGHNEHLTFAGLFRARAQEVHRSSLTIPPPPLLRRRTDGIAHLHPVKGRPCLLANGFASRQNKSQKQQPTDSLCDRVPNFHDVLPLITPNTSVRGDEIMLRCREPRNQNLEMRGYSPKLWASCFVFGLHQRWE